MYSVEIVVAMAQNRTIGINNELLWRLPSDMDFFKKLTMGYPVIMGKNTFLSIPEKFRPLPGRTNIVLTSGDARIPKELSCNSWIEAIKNGCIACEKIPDNKKIFIIGGAKVYEEALPFAHILHISHVLSDIQGDVYFPKIHLNEWKILKEEDYPQEKYPKNSHAYKYVKYERI